MIAMAVAGLFMAGFGWYMWANVRGLADVRRAQGPVVVARRAYVPPMEDKPLDTTARALIRELHAATPKS